ncbi:hypothetical protein JZ751_002411 [Albula glossodonta]|uniref:Uncharacterized protein n=1 Tax=Albula glossodonta TaxID=121402 RepID=A0A8T2MW40_9TELE|nr:hypothetical protein JZ751_002411 [Albula glossodonta]
MTAPRSYQMHEHTMHASPPSGSSPPPHRKQNLQLPVSLLGAPTRSVVHAGSCSGDCTRSFLFAHLPGDGLVLLRPARRTRNA